VSIRRLGLEQLDPLDTTGATAADGVYALSVTAGVADGLTPARPLPAGGSTAETPAKASGTDGDVVWVTGSVPLILLPAGSTAADVPAGTPYRTIILVEA